MPSSKKPIKKLSSALRPTKVDATSYYEIPYDKLYEADQIHIIITSGEHYIEDNREFDELGEFEGRLVGYRTATSSNYIELDSPIPLWMTFYNSWKNVENGDDEPPSPDSGKIALGIGRYDSGYYTCRVAIFDEKETLVNALLISMLSAGISGTEHINVSLSMRRGLESEYSFDEGEKEYAGYVDNYAWSVCGVDPSEFKDALDNREHQPPFAYFDALNFDCKVDSRRIARRLRAHVQQTNKPVRRM